MRAPQEDKHLEIISLLTWMVRSLAAHKAFQDTHRFSSEAFWCLVKVCTDRKGEIPLLLTHRVNLQRGTCVFAGTLKQNGFLVGLQHIPPGVWGF